MALRTPTLIFPANGTELTAGTISIEIWAQNLGYEPTPSPVPIGDKDLFISGSTYSINCWCSRWDVQNYNLIIETWLKEGDLETLRNNIRPGAVGELYKILGKPHFYDSSWEAANTLRFVTNANVGNLYNMREEKLGFVRNITTAPLEGSSGWTFVKLELAVSGSGDL